MEDILEIRKRFSRTSQLAEELYLTLSEAITTGIFKPGDRMYEEELAEQFQVSRTPVREAVKRLETEGLVCANSKHGFQVKIFSPYECEELIHAMEMFRQITTRTAAYSITQSYLLQLQDNVDTMASLPKDSINKRLMLNEMFHQIIVSSIGNSVINDLYGRMMKKYYLLYSNKASKMTYDMGAQQEHIEILNALKEHNPGKAFSLAVQHSDRSYARIRLLQE